MNEDKLSIIICHLKGHDIYTGWITKPKIHIPSGKEELEVVKGTICRTCLNNIKIYED